MIRRIKKYFMEVNMRQTTILSLFVFLFVAVVSVFFDKNTANAAGAVIDLPKAEPTKVSLDDAIKNRRTTRKFDEKKKVTLQELSNILFAMQGQTDGKKRAVSSAMGAYPLEIYVVANNVTGLDDGMYKMDIPKFKLNLLKKGDIRSELTAACMGQAWPNKAQLKIIVTCVWKRMADKSGDAAQSYSMFEAGAASQNAHLMAAALKLNVVPVGGMNPEKVANVIGVKYKEESPVMVNCIGR
jgi:SagB-type dehydrogenase family enzyme